MGCSIAINDELPRLIENLREVRPTVLVAVPRIFNRVHDGVRRQIAERGALAQRLFRRGLEAAMKRSAGESLGPVRWATWALADAAMFAKVRTKLGGRLRIAVSGSAALSRDVSDFISALGIQLLEGYGLTEASPVVAANTPTAHRPGSVGRPLSNVEVRVETGIEGTEVGGEILVRGPNVMLGYHNRPEETAAVLLPEGWLHTGDMGYLDDDGYLFISGRIKEQYKLENGKYVVPSPLEEDLKRSPYIDQLMVHGANRPHNVALVVLDEQAVRKWGEDQGLALGRLTEDPAVIELIERELERYGATLKSYERPRAFVLVLDEFTVQNGLLTPTLKLKRCNVLAKYGSMLDRLYDDGAS
jgi:long-chain acyl-CoA synthetase